MIFFDDIEYPAPKQEYKVLVRCNTFNQSKYIEEALNGFVIQQTNFPFVCFVMDDASTDGEQEVIKQWMGRECDMRNAEIIDIPTSEVIIVPHKANPSCTFAFYLLKQNLFGTGKKIYYLNPWREKCTYEAICEGDDYWIDPLKMQKQVDFLDNNPKHSMCFHAHKKLYQDGHLTSVNWCKQDVYNYSKRKLILGGCFMATNSMLFKTSVYKQYPVWALSAPVGDLPLMLVLLDLGNVAYLNDNMSVYRIAAIGSWSTKMKILSRKIEHKKRINKMWIEYLKWTKEKYHYVVMYNLMINFLLLYKYRIQKLLKK